ncbi:hypothetical protein KIL84_004924 [Mauremys mutica]|uniref:Uncharacterized protein n=1 Tax=Mauremys mutica TaxID=74926 RepID=A0A9D4B0F7_9SAUR|nr:hypothetical protein KIL84_004924 [Mauremys mutica]
MDPGRNFSRGRFSCREMVIHQKSLQGHVYFDKSLDGNFPGCLPAWLLSSPPGWKFAPSGMPGSWRGGTGRFCKILSKSNFLKTIPPMEIIAELTINSYLEHTHSHSLLEMWNFPWEGISSFPPNSRL